MAWRQASQQGSMRRGGGNGETYWESQIRSGCMVGSRCIASKVVGGSWEWSVVSAGAFVRESEEMSAL